MLYEGDRDGVVRLYLRYRIPFDDHPRDLGRSVLARKDHGAADLRTDRLCGVHPAERQRRRKGRKR